MEVVIKTDNEKIRQFLEEVKELASDEKASFSVFLRRVCMLIPSVILEEEVQYRHSYCDFYRNKY